MALFLSKKMEEVGKHRHEKVGQGIYQSWYHQIKMIIFSSYIHQTKNNGFIAKTVIVKMILSYSLLCDLTHLVCLGFGLYFINNV